MTHRSTKPARVVVISASVGAGHDAAADEIARRLRACGAEVTQHDFLALMPTRCGKLIRDSYQRMLSAAPWSYRLLYGALDRQSALGFQVAVFSSLAAKRTRAAIPEDTDLVVSTYPLASQVLGRLRRTEQLETPVATYLTDFSVHRLWIADGVDAHLAVHRLPADEAAEQGAAAVHVVAPVVDPRFGPAGPSARELARAHFGLPPRDRIALLVGGSWGAGDLDDAVREIDATRLVTCAVVCGRNEELRERLAAAGVKHVFGWVGDMPQLLHAADVLVQNAGGMTVLEAVRSELPVVTYRCIPGHGTTNSEALDEAKVAPWARHPEDLHRVLATALADSPRACAGLFHEADPIDTLLAIGGLVPGALAPHGLVSGNRAPNDLSPNGLVSDNLSAGDLLPGGLSRLGQSGGPGALAALFPGRRASGRVPAQRTPGLPGQQLAGQHAPGQQLPAQHTPGSQAPGQHNAGQHAPGQQHTPGQHAPGQLAPGQQAEDRHRSAKDLLKEAA